MTRTEAIKQLQGMVVGADWLSPYMVEALDMAIEALKAQDRPIICPRCGRTFSEAEGRERGMNHDATHCADFCVDCPMRCYRAELEVDLRKRWIEFIGIPLSYSHFYGTDECIRNGERSEGE